MRYRHIVLFRVHDDTPEAEVAAAIDALRRLAALPGVVELKAVPSLDTRKGQVIVLDSTFADDRAFDAYRQHPAHVQVGTMMSGISDWIVGDYQVS